MLLIICCHDNSSFQLRVARRSHQTSQRKRELTRFQVLIYHQTNHQTESKNPNFHPASHNFSKSFVPRDQFWSNLQVKLPTYWAGTDIWLMPVKQRKYSSTLKLFLFISLTNQEIGFKFSVSHFSICSCFEFHSSRNVGIIKVTETPLPISQNTKQKVTDHLTTLDRQKYKLE